MRKMAVVFWLKNDVFDAFIGYCVRNSLDKNDEMERIISNYLQVRRDR